NGLTPLHVALGLGAILPAGKSGPREHATRLLLAEHADPNVADRRGETALHAAAQMADAGFARAVIGVGAKVNAVDAQGKTPLHYACARTDAELVGTLLSAGADASVLDGAGWSAL